MEFGEHGYFESARAAGGRPKGPEKESLTGWLVKDEKDLKGLPPKLLVEVMLANRRTGKALTPEFLETFRTNVENLVRNDEVKIEEAIPWLAGADKMHESLVEVGGPKESFTPAALERILTHLSEENRKYFEQTIGVLANSLPGFDPKALGEIVGEKFAEGMKGLEALQSAQNELLRRAGFSGFVSAMDARAGINVQQFDTELPVWYESLSHEWKDIIRTNLGVLLGSYFKFRSAVKGAETIIASEDIAIYREALADMWEVMPGYRVAMATMTHDLFVTDDPSIKTLVLSGEGIERLKDVPKYKEELIKKLTMHIATKEKELLDPKQNRGGPENLRPEVAARFAVSAVWDLLYLGGAPDSGDTAYPRPELMRPEDHRVPNKGKNLGDVQAFCPSVRAFYLPWDQAKSKYFLGSQDPEGTDEGWGGPLGDWMAERIRHDPEFKRLFETKQGITRLMPERLMYSMFDLTFFETDAKQSVNEGKSISQVLISGGGGLKNLGDGLYDYRRPIDINFRQLKYAELWGGYSDSMDSAFKVYNAIIGRADKEFDRLKLSNALSKLRKAKGVSDIYVGSSGEMILAAAIISMSGGPIKYTSDVILPWEDSKYDLTVHQLLDDDRLFAGLESGARNRILRLMHAQDMNNLGGALLSIVSETPILGERRKKRSAATKEAVKYL